MDPLVTVRQDVTSECASQRRSRPQPSPGGQKAHHASKSITGFWPRRRVEDTERRPAIVPRRGRDPNSMHADGATAKVLSDLRPLLSILSDARLAASPPAGPTIRSSSLRPAQAPLSSPFAHRRGARVARGARLAGRFSSTSSVAKSMMAPWWEDRSKPIAVLQTHI